MATRNQNTSDKENDIRNSPASEESRENEQDVSDNKSGTGHRRTDEETNTSGYGSSQRKKADNVGPLESDLEQLPSEKRLDRGNLTGSGLG